MTHQRTTIRRALKRVIDNGASLVSGKVHVSRGITIDDADTNLPAAVIYTNDEEAEPVAGTGPGRTLERTVEAFVHIFLKETEQIDEDADVLAAEVEALIAADHTLGGACKDLWLTRTETLFKGNDGPDSGGGRVEYASVRLTYTVKYATLATTPGTLR